MTRAFLTVPDLGDLVAGQFGTDRRLVLLDRLAGGSKKGVYRLRLDDGTTTIFYVWTDDESYWPPSPAGPDDPFGDATGAELFAVNHAALTAAGVRVPELLLLDLDGRHRNAQLALVEDVGAEHLEDLIARDRAAADEPLAALGSALRRMHTTFGEHYGRLAAIERGAASQARRPEDVIVDQALRNLEVIADRDRRLAEARHRIADHVLALREPVPARRRYALIHGELGPDHVFLTAAREPVLIDIEGLTYFDVEWEHAWLQLRFGADYPALDPVPQEPARLALYRYAQVLSLIEGPLRIADTDFPDRDWMLGLAAHNIDKALAALG